MKKIVFLLVFLLLLGGCNQQPADVGEDAEISLTDPPAATPQATVPPRTGTTVLADGQLVAVNPLLPLSFTVSGRLVEVFVQPGDVVKKGAILATLDETALSKAVTQAELQVAQAQNALAQAQLALEELVNWEADEWVVALAEANLTLAEANYEQALTQDSAAGNSLTSTSIAIDQAVRSVANAQEAYDNAWDSARDWEMNYNERICYPGQGGSVPCTGNTWKERLENDREGTTQAVQNAEEGLAVARANYNLTAASLNKDNALNASAGVASAEQALNQAQRGPTEADITLAQLQVDQANLSLEQAAFSLEQARNNIEDAILVAPWQGTVLSLESLPGAFVGAGSPILTLFDAESLQFYTSNLSERDLAEIEEGQSVQITLKSYPGQPINGVVVRIASQASGAIGDAATFPVVIDLEPTDRLLLSGMTGRAEIQRLSEGG